MKRILILGAGRSAAFLIHRLLEDAAAEGWFVTVGELDLERARQVTADHPRSDAICFDVNDAALRSAEIERADVVVNMLPAAYQDLVAWDCVKHGRHMISVSYRDQSVRDLHADAKRAGVLLLCEMGLDPGIDHMSGVALIRRIESEHGRIVGFRSYGSGIPAPEPPANPLGYVMTWDPRNVVMAGFEGAQYMEEGRVKIVPFHHVFQHTWPVEVEGLGRLEAYANRDSMSYMRSFGLEHVRTMIRGTLRYPGWSETWSQMVQLGLPNETLRIDNLGDRTYREVVEMFVPTNVSGTTLQQRVARYLHINPTGRIMENLLWLGLFSDERIDCVGDTSSAMLQHLLKIRLPLTPATRDLVVLLHELDVEWPDEADRPDETITSTLLVHGEPGGFTAMARTVGLPVAIAVKRLLAGELPLTGTAIPTHPSIAVPVLDEVRAAGINFVEKTQPRRTRRREP